MARKRQSTPGWIKLLRIVAILTYLGAFIAVFRKFGGQYSQLFLLASSLGAVLIASLYSRCIPRHNLQQSALVKAEAIIQMSIDPLSRRRAQLVYMDDYGCEHLETWEAEIDSFIYFRILPMLDPEERLAVQGDQTGMLRLLTLRTLNGIDSTPS